MSDKPRWIQRLYAWVFGYFWLPCPRCGRMFGGHEEPKGILMHRDGSGGWATCPRCAALERGP